jgi:prepilin-type processing-associated H-X9-DG protein
MKAKNIMKTIVILMFCFCINLNVFSSETSKEPVSVIKSCIDDQTFAVVYVDIEKLNLNAFVEKAVDFVNRQAGPEIAQHLQESMTSGKEEIETKINGLRKAGCKGFFVVFSMYDFPYFFAAFQSGNNQAGLSQAIMDITKDFNFGKLDLYSTNGLIFVGPEPTIARLKTISPVQSETFVNGFKACGNTTLRAVLFPNSDQRKIMTEMLPQIPVGTQKSDLTILGKDFEWASLGVDGPPSISLNVTIQAQNSQSADNLLLFIRNFYSIAEQNPSVQELLPQLDQLLNRLIPEKHENQLVLKVEPKDADSLIENFIGKSMLNVRATAIRMVCGSNLSGIGKALLIYANDYNDMFPPNMEILISKAEMTPKTLLCPSTALKDSYIYRGSDLTTSDTPGLIMVYDKKGNHEGGRNVLFLDSHVEWVKEERFMQLIEDDNQYRQKKGYKVISAK